MQNQARGVGWNANSARSLCRPLLRPSVPSMLAQFLQQVPRERAFVAVTDILAHMLRLPHSRDGGADHRMRKNEAKCHFGKRHSGWEQLFETLHAFDRGG